jgi:hydroxyacylglutathione hydrolase
MILRPLLHEETACASYVFGCLSERKLAVVDPHEEFVDAYLAAAERVGAPIVAVFETHVQADHRSGLPSLVEATGATAYLPSGAPVEFEHEELDDDAEVELGNTRVGGDPLPLAHQLYDFIQRLLELPDDVVVYPSHYGGSVCGRALSGNPFSTIGFERRHNQALRHDTAEAFAQALLVDLPPPPADQAAIVEANKRGARPVQT